MFRLRDKSSDGPMGVSSTRGVRVPDASKRTVYARMCTFGSWLASAGAFGFDACRVSVAIVELSDFGVGAREMLMTCSRPVRQIESMTSPLKKSISMDFNWMNRGCVSKSSEAKCNSGLWPGVDFGVYPLLMLRQSIQ